MLRFLLGENENIAVLQRSHIAQTATNREQTIGYTHIVKIYLLKLRGSVTGTYSIL